MSNECIQVVVRMRPFNTKEKNEGRTSIVDMDMELNQVSIKNPEHPDAPPKSFTFDSVYDGTTQQRAFYEESCFGLIENVLVGFNGTIFAYGQTGCGKTFTMQGPNDPPEMRGVIPNSFTHIFDQVKASTDCEYLVRCSYLEIYNEVIKDLLGDQKNPAKCDLKEDPQKGIIVSNLTDVVVKTEEDMDHMLNKGLANRTVGSTLMNAESSRSHSIFTIVVEMNNKDENGKDHIRAGKLNLVDLAGSERQKKTGASGDRLKEGSKINLSLSALGNVISALSDGGGKHIPYRDSKLTRMLQDSLGGNTKTLMVAAMSPADYNYDETLSTLRYANRAKSIKNKPKINEDPKDAMIREFKEEIERLRAILEQQGGGAALAGLLAAPPTGAGAAATTASSDGGAKHIDNSPQHEQREGALTESAGVRAEAKADAMDFAGLADASEAKASPRRKSPRTKKSPRVEKEIVEVHVEVERVPEEHLQKQKKLEEYSQAVEEERDYFGEQLKEMQNEVDVERQKRDELTRRLKQLQSKLVGNNLSIDIPSLDLQNHSPEDVLPSDRQQKEKEEAQARMKERKAKAKQRKESKKKAQNDRIEREAHAMEDELQETISASQDTMDKKIAKIKKKFEKKLVAARSEIDDLHEEFELEREEMLESIRESSKDTQLFQQICLALLDEKKLRQVVDKCQYDEEAGEWIIPYLKSSKETDFKLPGINSARRDEEPSPSNMQSSSARYDRRSRTDSRPNSKENKQHYHENGDSSNVPSINLPPHAPSKPPMPRSARRDKKRSKPPQEVRQDLPDAQDEAGTGENAGAIDDWGFAGNGSAPAPARKKKTVAEPPGDMEYDPSLVLNHIGGNVGDRQSSRHGSRRKNRSSSGKRKQSNVSGSESESIAADKGFAASCSPRAYSDGVSFPQL